MAEEMHCGRVKKPCKWKVFISDGRTVVVGKGLTKIKHGGKNPFGKILHLKSFKTI